MSQYTDKHSGQPKSITAPFDDGQVVTVDVDFLNGNISRGIIVTVAGDVEFETSSGGSLIVPGLVPGVIHPMRTKKIIGSGTTATGLVVVW